MVAKSSQTQTAFCLFLETSFIILDSGRAVVGINPDHKKNLIMETMNGHQTQHFAERQKEIKSLVLHKSTRTLFVGGEDRNLVQYKQNEATGKWAILARFGDIGVSAVCSLAFTGDLLFAGGKNGCFRVINLKEGEAVQGPYETAIGEIYSLQVCAGLYKHVFLSVGGRGIQKSGKLTDFLDISSLCKQFYSESQQVPSLGTAFGDLQAPLESNFQLIQERLRQVIDLKDRQSGSKSLNEGNR